jgi:adenylate cyclase
MVVTDLKGSTMLWSQVESEMPTVLRLHDVLVRQKLAKYGGREIITEGDSFQLAFRDVNTALSWCIEVQQQLLRQSWPSAVVDRVPEACGKIVEDPNRIEARFRSGEFWGDLLRRHQDAESPTAAAAAAVAEEGGMAAIREGKPTSGEIPK